MPELTLHSFAVPSIEAVNTSVPVMLKTAEVTGAVWPLNVRMHSTTSDCQSFAVQSDEDVMTKVSSGENSSLDFTRVSKECPLEPAPIVPHLCGPLPAEENFVG